MLLLPPHSQSVWSEHPSPTHSMPQLGTDLWWSGPGKTLDLGTQKQCGYPGRVTMAFIGTKYTQKQPTLLTEVQLIELPQPPPHHSSQVGAKWMSHSPTPWHNLALDLRWMETKEKIQPRAAFEQSQRHLTGSTSVSAQTPYISTIPLGQSPSEGRRGNIHLKGTEPAQAQLSGLSVKQLGNNLGASDDGHLSEMISHVTPWVVSSSSKTSRTPYQGDSKSADMKDVTGIHIKSSPPLKGTETQFTRTLLHKNTFKSAPVAVSSKFIETKLNKMKRQRNCSPNWKSKRKK